MKCLLRPGRLRLDFKFAAAFDLNFAGDAEELWGLILQCSSLDLV
jgi:hypothetical protein